MTGRRSPVDLGRIGPVDRILVVRLKAMGDIALSLPIVWALRERFPRARIDYLVGARYAGALDGDTGLDEVIPLEGAAPRQARLAARLRRRRYDVAIDLLSSPRSAVLTLLSGAHLRIGMDVGRHNWCFHRVLPRALLDGHGAIVRQYTLESNREYARMIGLGDPGPGPDPRGWRSGLAPGFPAAETERAWAGEWTGSLGERAGRLCGIVPGATYVEKSWPVERFVELAGRIPGELGLVPLVFWGPGEEAVAGQVAAASPAALMAPPASIPRLGAIVGRCRVVVGIDSGPKHLAVLQGVPTVTLFGPTDPRVWDPMTGRHRVLGGPERGRGGGKQPAARRIDEIAVDEVIGELRLALGAETDAGGGR
ncbi:MAG: glycosyltransferase family 9 protein [Candidatus Krumholzibacteriota bacterium]|nr:glycosyltransferase family 9 protein [Candidatus Krumholzibacteriota bacterium]